jgi:hypothetical protein
MISAFTARVSNAQDKLGDGQRKGVNKDLSALIQCFQPVEGVPLVGFEGRLGEVSRLVNSNSVTI